MIEVKYLSGKSGDYKSNHDNEVNMEPASSDQLAREYQDLKGYGGDYTERSLIYLTAHRSLPEEDVKAGYRELADSGCDDYKDNVYWLSWYEVHKTVSGLLKGENNKYWRIVLSDIQCLLHRKGLRRFEGFKRIIDKFDPIFYPTTRPIFYRSKKEAS